MRRDEDEDDGPAPGNEVDLRNGFAAPVRLGNEVTSRTRARCELMSDVRALAKTYTAEAIQTLADVMHDAKDSKARVSAANSLLDRAWGKSVETIEHSGRDGAPIQTQRLDVSKLEPNELRLMTELMLKARAEVS